MIQALTGFRVLDFGQYIAAPYAAMLLAEQGAEVIKIEPPGGDPIRCSPGFMVWNRSKRGIALDLKKPEGRQIARELSKKADVLIESFRPGVAERLGIGYEDLKGLNPNLVYCSVTGYGQAGPYRDRPGWDPLVSSTVGIYLEQGGRDPNPPIYLVLPLASYYTAFMAAYSIAAALFTRETTGSGQRVDVSLFNSLMAATPTGMLVDFEGKIRIPFLDPQGQLPLYKLYQGSDGKWFFLGLGNPAFFTKFAVLMGHEEWLADPLFEGAPFLILPPRNHQLIEMFKEIFATKTRDEWLALFRSEDIPCAPAQPIDAFFQDPQVLANGMVVELEEPGIGRVRQMGIPVRLAENPGCIRGRSPRLGEHTEEILTGLLGLPREEIDNLREKGVLEGPEARLRGPSGARGGKTQNA